MISPPPGSRPGSGTPAPDRRTARAVGHRLVIERADRHGCEPERDRLQQHVLCRMACFQEHIAAGAVAVPHRGALDDPDVARGRRGVGPSPDANPAGPTESWDERAVHTDP